MNTTELTNKIKESFNSLKHNCPTCNYEMLITLPNSPVFWCSTCGTISIAYVSTELIVKFNTTKPLSYQPPSYDMDDSTYEYNVNRIREYSDGKNYHKLINLKITITNALNFTYPFKNMTEKQKESLKYYSIIKLIDKELDNLNKD